MENPCKPQFHFAPKKNWMNDPNGMFYLNGVYHLYYQYFPYENQWGPMHWGHATSQDLIHWEHHPIALSPDELGYIFSGSIVVDHQNTAGFGKKTVIALFTYHDPKKETQGRIDYQCQGMAYSLDEGETFYKYEKNPIIPNEGIRDFRDPKVFWYEEKQKWIMVVAQKDRIGIYASKNLKKWKKESDFGEGIGVKKGVWECPDLFKIKNHWVLLVSIDKGGPNEGSATQYFIGTFDGKEFKSLDKKTRWLDWGMDHYAGVTWHNTPDNKLILIGWMNNWLYAKDIPTENWRGMMTLPRELDLVRNGKEHQILMKPIKEWENYLRIKDQYKGSETKIHLEEKNEFIKNEIVLNSLPKQSFLITFYNDVKEKIELSVAYDKQKVVFNRLSSGPPHTKSFQTHFFNEQTIPLNDSDEITHLNIILDQYSIEIFINDGLKVLTSLLFPSKPYTNFEWETFKMFDHNLECILKG